jgi:hypothetical protein
MDKYRILILTLQYWLKYSVILCLELKFICYFSQRFLDWNFYLQSLIDYFTYQMCFSHLWSVNDSLIKEYTFLVVFVSHGYLLYLILVPETHTFLRHRSSVVVCNANLSNFTICNSCITNNKSTYQNLISKLCVNFHAIKFYVKMCEFK